VTEFLRNGVVALQVLGKMALWVVPAIAVAGLYVWITERHRDQ
jgi:hypothetical protein